MSLFEHILMYGTFGIMSLIVGAIVAGAAITIVWGIEMQDPINRREP